MNVRMCAEDMPVEWRNEERQLTLGKAHDVYVGRPRTQAGKSSENARSSAAGTAECSQIDVLGRDTR